MIGAKDLGFKVVTGLHEAIFRASKGRLLGRALGMPVLVLTTTGRKSGRARTTMLTAPLVEGDRLVIVASKGGDDRHPAWFLNLRDDPHVEVTTGGEARRMVARVAEGAERADLWARIVAEHDNYAGYQRRTERDIPVVVLEPVAA